MSSILSGLNDNQLKAVTHQGTPLLVLAGAGSGKTRVLTHRAAYFIDEHHISPSQVLLLTFTNKAAQEMKERMSLLLKGSEKQPGGPVEATVTAGTFHSFCCRILRQDGKRLGLSPDFCIYDTDDQEVIIKNIINDLNLTTKEFKPSSVLYYIEDAKNKFLTPKDISVVASGFWESYAAKIYKIYQQKLDEYQAVDFNDLLFKVVSLFKEYPDVLNKYQEKYTHILVDEYQDTNQIQYLLTKMLGAKYSQVTAVGDASQAIYGWRGANYRNLISFTKDFVGTTVINLEENYRSTQIILDAANAVISKNASHPIVKLFTRKQSLDKILVFEAGSEVDEADFISQKIQYLHQQLYIPYKEIAVLYRMNAQSRTLEESFLKHTIPYVLIGGLRFYERAEVKDVLAMLRTFTNPSDHLSSERAKKALGKKRYDAFVNQFDSVDKDSTSIQIMENLLVGSGYLQKFDPQDEDDQKRIENIKELKSVATSFPKLSDLLENIALVQAEYSLQEKNKKKENREGVRLMTLHSSKGLEFTSVFLVGFEEGIIPHSRSMVDDSDIEEERRLCYVGITRARDFLFITYATRRLYFGKSSLNQASRFLSDVPSELLDYETSSVRDRRSNNNDGDSGLIYDPDIY